MQDNGLLSKLKIFLEMIKFSHTIFALPFALTGALLAARGIPSAGQLFWIVMAMVGARTAAMAMNRLIDADIDGRNPRTASRAIPAGLLSRGVVALYIVISLLLLLYAAYRLNPLCVKLAPIAIFFLLLYSYCKPFTSLAHIVLGLCLAAAPVGAWVAIRGEVTLPPVLLGLAVLFWVAGFDILYALQDLEFDRQAGLHSIPVKLGVRGSLLLARLFSFIMILLLIGAAITLQLAVPFYCGIAASAALITYEHWLVRDGDLGKLDLAFFTMNGYVSVIILAATTAEIFISGGSR